MKIFINDTANLNYPLVATQDVSGTQSMIMDMSIISNSTVYMTDMWSTGAEVGGLFTEGEQGESPCGHFAGAVNDQVLSIYNDAEEPIGWVALGPGASSAGKYNGLWKVNGTCVVMPTAVRNFSVNGVSRPYPNVLKITATDYIQSSEDGQLIGRAAFANSQDLDARDWDKEGPILSINGIKTVTGDCTLNLMVPSTHTTGKILVTDPGNNFICTGTYEVRDNAIMDHASYGLSMELPLDNMVRVWAHDKDTSKGCPRRSLS